MAEDACFELSIGQQALWFLHELAPDSGAYNVAAAMNLHCPVDVPALATAVRRVAAGNSVLNCVFRAVAGEVRRYRGGTETVLELHDVSADDAGARDVARRLAQRPFRLDREPPVRFTLMRRGGAPDVLLMAAHHIATDNASQVLVMREVLDQYAAVVAGVHRDVADTGADFDRFVRREREFLGSARAAKARAYWRDELGRAGGRGLPTDRPRPDVYRFEGAEIDVELPSETIAGASPFAYLFAVFQLLLFGFSGRADIVIGYPVSVRPDRRYRGAVGNFVNTLPLCARLEPGDSFGTLLARTREKLWRGGLYRDYPFALMPRLVDADRDSSRAGLVSVMFVMGFDDPTDPFYEIWEPGRRVEYAGMTVSHFDMPQQLGQFDMTLQVLRHGAASRAKLKYNTSLFTAETVRELAGEYVSLLRSVGTAQVGR
ncbi:condensation domain-containing protein [Phytohabitans aurantiacus]|uniref:Condensation domain-containing protein n=1 Tax=Phytohabitans aurantiacus TaxID=3016789 RepID=A0ABQ5R118_9ACTN|nr:condensation domain-containing protein [Phytohabitans aurantiacus]GLH99270.1 hypothetical protein Pa4123_45450 [Phytohabitans aurantiacus]